MRGLSGVLALLVLGGCSVARVRTLGGPEDTPPPPPPAQERLTLELVGTDLHNASLGLDVNGVGMVNARMGSQVDPAVWNAAPATPTNGPLTNITSPTGEVHVSEPQWRLEDGALHPVLPTDPAEAWLRLTTAEVKAACRANVGGPACKEVERRRRATQ